MPNLSFAAALLLAASATSAQLSTRYDEESGRNLLHYPPHRYADFIHMRLELVILDMNTPAMQGRETLTLKPLDGPMDLLSLDAKLLNITSVACAGHAITSTADGEKLDIAIDPPLAVGEEAEFVIDYRVSDPPDGLYWSPESPATPGRAAQIYTQGEAEMNSYWFPCHDYPNDRLTTEVVATVPAGYMVSSNGRLVEHATTADGAERWHWLQDKPHVPYLVTLVVGKFDVVDVGTPALPMPVYVPPGRGQDVQATFGRTPRMVELFSRLLDEPYPWARYAQLTVWNFIYGGEENTSATTLRESCLIDADALIDTDSEGLISHELAHQWFGDFITCNSWADIWLNEGFATYLTPLWSESVGGREAYDADIRADFDQVIANDRGTAPDTPAMVSNQYQVPDDVFGRGANPYPKGASILHMLRRRLGDGPFFASLAHYVDQHALTTAETSDLRKSMEEVTGDTLERFFHQWCDRPGIPRLDITITWATTDTRTGRGELVVSVDQTQTINGDNPAFAFTLPIWVEDSEGKGRMASIDTETTHAEGRFLLDAEPSVVAVDPDLAVLAEMTIHQSATRWEHQFASGRTLASCVQAIRAMGQESSTDFGDMLERIVRRSDFHDAVRIEAGRALGVRRDAARLLSLVDDPPNDPQIRESVIDNLATVGAADPETASAAAPLLLSVLQHDPSQLAQAAAVRALGKIKATAHLGEVLLAAGRPSQADRIREAAVGALADLDQPQGLPVAILLSGPEQTSRTRGAAATAIARLAHHDPDAAYTALTALLVDRHIRIAEAAGKALVDLADARTLADLDRYAQNARGDRQKRHAAEWTAALRAKLPTSDTAPSDN